METMHHRSADEYGMFVWQLLEYEGLKLADVKNVIILIL
jgi:pantothenate kinase type III